MAESEHEQPISAEQSAAGASSLAREWDYNDPSMRRDAVGQFTVLDQMREQCPIMYSERMGSWWMFGYDAVREVFERDDIFASNLAPQAGDSATETFADGYQAAIPLNSDPPEHPYYRKLLNPLFSSPEMAKLETDLRRFAGELLDPIAARGSGDLIADFCLPFPSITFCRLMGWPLEDTPKLIRWTSIYFNSASPDTARLVGSTEVDSEGRLTHAAAGRILGETSAEITGYMRDIYAQRREHPRDDIMSRLLALRAEDGEPLSEEELLSIAFVLLLGGLHTVVSQLGLILHDFALHPEHRRAFIAVMDDEQAVGLAVQELIRHHSLTIDTRRVTQDCVFRGHRLRRNELVAVDTSSADRDPAKFDRAGELVLDRRPNPHLGYGHGRHRCLGLHLANRELRIALQELHRRMPDYEIAPGAEVNGIVSIIRGIERLPITVG